MGVVSAIQLPYGTCEYSLIVARNTSLSVMDGDEILKHSGSNSALLCNTGREITRTDHPEESGKHPIRQSKRCRATAELLG
jgi:hypothetical protein